MITSKAFFFGLILLVACQTRTIHTDVNHETSDSSETTIAFNNPLSITDTLDKYSNADSIVSFKTIRVFVGIVDKTNIGLCEISDTVTVVYQKPNSAWLITDTIDYSMKRIGTADLDGDNFKDIVITYSITGSGGNSENVCLLYNPVTNRFLHNKHFDLPNIRYDKESHLIFSAWWAGVLTLSRNGLIKSVAIV